MSRGRQHSGWILFVVALLCGHMSAAHGQTQSKGPEPTHSLRIMLVGKTGSGKSATANTILGQKLFREDVSSKSVTAECQREKVTRNGTEIIVIDTPGLYDTTKTKEEVKTIIKDCIYLSVPGPHVFLLVLSMKARLTEEEKNTMNWIGENFGGDASLFTLILFTHEDQLENKSFEDYLKENIDMQRIINRYGRRYHSFNNLQKNNRRQVKELLVKIEKIIDDNNGNHYTSEMYEEAQRKLNDVWPKCIAAIGGIILITSLSPWLGVVASGAASSYLSQDCIEEMSRYYRKITFLHFLHF